MGALLDAFLEAEVPDDDEALVTWYDAARHGRSRSKSADGYIGEDKAVFRGGRGDDRRGQRDHPDRRPRGTS